MTAKEKAEELYYLFDANTVYALNCVDEILFAITEDNDYWEEVKREIILI